MGENVIECRGCGRENRTGRRFCVGCGASLAAGCPACGAPYEPDERFCGECGSPLSGAAPNPPAATPAPARPSALAPAPVAERRLVTVLFADLVGFTPFAAERDAEDVRETLSRYFELASDVIARYGGTIEKFIGDAVMAVWGVPAAHEDDAERAVRAGLDLVDAIRTLGPGMQARAGVLTGEAAVSLGATNQGMVAGDIVNTAARLQSVAQPGTVLAGEPTMRAASKAITFEPVGPQQLKGKEAPVIAFRALRIVAEVGGRNRQEGLEAPFVGRDDEMRALKDQFLATAKDGRTRLVSVVGPAGIGKSRLAWEFSKYADGLVDTVWWHQGRSPAYGQGVTFWALGEMVRGRCDLLEGADEATTRTNVASTVAAHVPDPAERAWIEPALLALLGIGERGTSPEQLFSAWRTFFERLAASAPVVLLFEDLHWADTGTLDFLDHLLDWTRDLPMLVVTLARPDLLERRPSWGGGRRHFLGLTLDPLPEVAMRELLAGLVPGLPERAVAAIVARADGVPLYAVETVRSLLAEGRLRQTDTGYEPVGDLAELAVPETLAALIASRLDALEPVDRSLLQDAAVLGQSFTPAALAAVSGAEADALEPRLRGLVRRELLWVESDPRSPERGQYTFVQALIREVAYNTLARNDRKAKHLAAARWFESLGSDELAGALARHYLAAWQVTPEGPDADALAGQARRALTAAADRSIRLYANEQAIELLREAATVTVDSVEKSHLLSRAGGQLDLIGRYADGEAIGREAYALARTAADGAAEAHAVSVLYLTLVSLARRSEAIEIVEQTRERHKADRTDPYVLRLDRHLAVQSSWDRDYERASTLVEEMLRDAELAGLPELVLEGLAVKGSILSSVRRTMEARALREFVARSAPDLGRHDLADHAASDLAMLLLDEDPAAMVDVMKPILDGDRRTGNRFKLVVDSCNASEAAIRVGRWDWVVEQLGSLRDSDLAPSERAMVDAYLMMPLACRGEDVSTTLAELARLRGTSPEHAEQIDDAAASAAFVSGRIGDAARLWTGIATTTGMNAPAGSAKAARAWLWLGDLVAARAQLAALTALGIHGPVDAATKASIRAGIAALEGRPADARREYRVALSGWRDLGLPWDEALTCLDLVLLLGPDDPESAAAAERAREVFERLGAWPFLAKLDAALAGAAVSSVRT
jgi:class 3 adenylate cyclase/tetratricopeptide (TPR) repeat protein